MSFCNDFFKSFAKNLSESCLCFQTVLSKSFPNEAKEYLFLKYSTVLYSIFFPVFLQNDFFLEITHTFQLTHCNWFRFLRFLDFCFDSDDGIGYEA